MRRRAFIKLALAAIASASAAYLATSIALPSMPKPPGSPTSGSLSGYIGIETIATDLEAPWSIAPIGDQEYLVSERPGRILYISARQGSKRLVASFDVASVGEAGLLGIALHPEYPSKPVLYAYLSYWDSSSIYNRVVRMRLEASGGSPRVYGVSTILDRIPGAYIHNGGRIRFGPDHMIYISTGDASSPTLAQDLRSLAGKILRVDEEGMPARDNPFYPSPVYSYGHRNPQGFDWHPSKGYMVASEHGPVGHDEINLIEPGQNYGWPEEVGQGSRYRSPLIESGAQTWAPSGASFIRGEMFREFAGDLLVACLRGQKILRISFSDSGGDIKAYASEEMLVNRLGRLRDVAIDTDGSILILTSNRDGRGSPLSGDDKVLRLFWRGQASL